MTKQTVGLDLRKKARLWHFARTREAEFYIRQFAQDLPALTLYAPRSKGVTEFLQTDLSTVAAKAGYVPIYVSLWQSQSNPAATICHALQNSFKAKNFFERFVEFVTAPAQKSEFEVSQSGPKFKTEFAHEREKLVADEANMALPQRLDEAFERNGKKPLVLMIDQIQTLVGRPGYDPFIRALRAALDSRKANVHVVFAGSSRIRLGKVFRPVESPMHNFSQPYEFPDMPSEYLDHMAKSFETLVGKKMPIDQLTDAFAITSKRPGYLHVAIRKAMNAADRGEAFDIRELARTELHSFALDSGMRERYFSVTPLAQTLLIAVSQGAQPRDPQVASFQAAMDGGPFSQNQIYQALNELVMAQILFTTANGIYEVEDQSFSSWIENDLPLVIQVPQLSKVAESVWPNMLQRINVDTQEIENVTNHGCALQQFCQSATAFSALELGGIQSGFMDGGCRVLADAICRWSGGTAIPVYLSHAHTGQAQHVVARYNDMYFDVDGVARETEVLKKMMFIERVDCYVDDTPPSNLSEIPFSHLAAAHLACELAKQLGPFEDFVRPPCVVALTPVEVSDVKVMRIKHSVMPDRFRTSSEPGI